MDVQERMEIFEGDLTTLKVDAIVNAANASLLGGGGVDGAIHRAAGPRLKAHCATLGGCEVGQAKTTPAFDLEDQGVRFIIHTVGPVWGDDPLATGDEKLGYRLEDNQLAQCYLAAMTEAEKNGCRTVAFPAISTGVFGFPKDRAAKIAVGHVQAVLRRSELPEKVVFACFGAEDAAIYRRYLGADDLVQLGALLRRPTAQRRDVRGSTPQVRAGGEMLTRQGSASADRSGGPIGAAGERGRREEEADEPRVDEGGVPPEAPKRLGKRRR